VNGAPATLGIRVAPTDELRLDGRPIRRRAVPERRIFLCHRSPGESLTEPHEEGAMASRLPARSGRRFIAVSPMPRIDGGLEILTSDGSMALRLQRAAHYLPCEFSVRVRGELTEVQRRGVLSGVLDRGAALEVELCEPSGGVAANRWYKVCARGGSGKDVRQLFERQAALVSRVLRVRFGPLALERRIARGAFRELTREETDALLEASAGSRNSAR
jgi:23S rRNA pseudouridine2605 synthase